MNRSYELEPVDGGWKLRLLEDGEEVGGGRGGDDDYDYLAAAGKNLPGSTANP